MNPSLPESAIDSFHSSQVPVNAPGSSDTGKPVEPGPCDASIDRDVQQVDQHLNRIEQLAEQLENWDGSADIRDKLPELPTDFRLSIVVPVYNEQATIRQIITKLLQLPLPKEIIVVDDGSTDGTPDELQRLHGVPNLRIVIKPSNEGKGAALRTGFQYVSGTVVVVQDADLEYDPFDIPRLLHPLLAGQADVVYGSRFLEQRWTGSSTIHRLGNRLLTLASNWTTGLQLTDMETCYKAFPAKVLNDLVVRQERFGIEPELTAKLARRGLRFCEIPVGYNARDWDEGKKIGLRDAFNALFCILRYAWID